MTSSMEAAVFELLAQAGDGKSISPEAVARTIDPDGWRRRLAEVRSTSVGLARDGRLVITRHGKPADPNSLKGVYRLKLVSAFPIEPPAENAE